MLDNMAYIDIESFCQPPRILYRVVGPSAFSQLEKEMQYFIAVSAVTGMPGAFYS